MKPIDWGGKDVIDPRFLRIVNNWIEADGEVYVVNHHARSGGMEEHWIFESYFQFATSLNNSYGECGVEVYRHPHFPLRGIVTEEFIFRAKLEFKEGSDWIMIFLEESNGQWITVKVHGDNTHKALEEELHRYLNKFVIIGPDIHWPNPPNDYPGEWIYGEFNHFKEKDPIPTTIA